jgi:spermidine/putrescine transport system ATP-binding protein
VADFIGETNFLDGKVSAINGQFATVVVGGDKPFVGRVNGDVRVGADATISVRPEKMQLLEKEPASPNAYQVKVHSIGYVGSDTRVIVELGPTHLDVWEQNSVSTLDPNYFFRAGESAWMTFKPENALVLAS